MLTFFRTNQIFSSILLIFYIFLLRFSVFLAPFKWTPSGQGIFSENLYSWIGSQDIVSHIVAFFLLLVQGFLINTISLNNRLSNETNLFPGVFYVLTCCLVPDLLYLSPVLLGNTFVLIAMLELFGTYKNAACADKIFNIGFWVGVASLFYFPFIFYFIFLMAGLNILRAFKIEERLMTLIGLFIPYLLVGLYFFWFDRFGEFWDIQISQNLSFLGFGGGGSSWATYLNIVIFGLLIIFSLANNGAYFAKKNIQVQKKISILYWIMISAGIAVFFQQGPTFEHMMMLAPPLGIFLALSFTDMKPQWAESIHFLMFLSALALQFIPWQL